MQQPTTGEELAPLESTHKHKRQSFWQILFPIILVSLMAIAGLVLIPIFLLAPGASVMADLSLAVLICPAAILALLPLALIAGLIYGFGWLHDNTAPITNQAQYVMKQVHGTTDRVTKQFASALIGVGAWFGGIGNALNKWGLNGKSNGDEPESPTNGSQPKS